MKELKLENERKFGWIMWKSKKITNIYQLINTLNHSNKLLNSWL